MVLSVIAIIAIVAISFVLGVLVGRNNKSIVEDIVSRYKADFDAIMKKIAELEAKIK